MLSPVVVLSIMFNWTGWGHWCGWKSGPFIRLRDSTRGLSVKIPIHISYQSAYCCSIALKMVHLKVVLPRLGLAWLADQAEPKIS
jgi:hypothetical protein